MTTRPSRAGARTDRLLGLPVPYAVPVVAVDDKRGFASRENAPCVWVATPGTMPGAGENGALIFTPEMVGGCVLRIPAFGSMGTGVAIAPMPALVSSNVLTPLGDSQPGVWLDAIVATANLPPVDVQILLVTTMYTGDIVPYPEYLFELEIPPGSSLMIWGDAEDPLVAILQAYVVEM